MTREQMIAWLTLEGWALTKFSDSVWVLTRGIYTCQAFGHMNEWTLYRYEMPGHIMQECIPKEWDSLTDEALTGAFTCIQKGSS